jgi:hypothetical protein
VAVHGQHIYWADNGLAIGVANLDGTAVNQSFITGANRPEGVAVSVPVAELTPSLPPAFASTPQGTLSAPETLTLQNARQHGLTVAGSLAGGTVRRQG